MAINLLTTGKGSINLPYQKIVRYHLQVSLYICFNCVIRQRPHLAKEFHRVHRDALNDKRLYGKQMFLFLRRFGK